MSHYRRKIDSNQTEIANGLEDIHCTVIDMHVLGMGVPDLMCGYKGETFLLEVKTKEGHLNERQEKWNRHWRGRPVAIVTTIEEAYKAIGYKKRPYVIAPIVGEVKA